MSVEHQLRMLRWYAGVSSLVLVYVATTAAQATMHRNLSEITVNRINVVKNDGRTRMVISNSARQTPAIVGGKALSPDRKRPAGIIFFNDEGDEDGGLVFQGQKGKSAASLTFDQYQQDQVVGVVYGESNGQRNGGLVVWDRTDVPLPELVRELQGIQALPASERQKALDAIGATDNGARRIFVGKAEDRSVC